MNTRTCHHMTPLGLSHLQSELNVQASLKQFILQLLEANHPQTNSLEPLHWSSLLQQMSESNTANLDLLEQSTLEVMQFALAYATLAASPSRSIEQEDRLAEMLELSCESEILNFWIDEVDHILAHEQGLLDEDDRESYKDQQSLLRERAGTDICPTPKPKRRIRFQRN
ncbi:MAG TPA: hypothetical protein V6C65_13030 [Allocoleopsis sp.]